MEIMTLNRFIKIIKIKFLNRFAKSHLNIVLPVIVLPVIKSESVS